MTARHQEFEERESRDSDSSEQIDGFWEQFDGFSEQFEGFGEQFDGFSEQFAGFWEQFGGFPERFGDRLCLDFVNTLESPLSTSPIDHLRDAQSLVRWGKFVDLIDDEDAYRLVAAISQQPEEAQSMVARAVTLREALRRIFRAIAHGETPGERDLATLRAEYVGSLQASRLAQSEGHFRWQAESAGPAALIGAVASSAVDVLTTDDLARVKECPGALDCGHLFYDTSKNGRRRWCSMLTCGSRVKMRQWYSRQRDHGRQSARKPRPPRVRREPKPSARRQRPER